MLIVRKSILIIFLIIIQKSICGQENNPLQTTADINLYNKTLKEVIQYLETNYNLVFSYSDNILPTRPIPSVKYSSATIKTILTELLKPYSIDFKVINNQIILFQSKKKNSYYSISGFITDAATGEKLIGASVFCKELSFGTISNGYGFYSITIPEGKYEFTFSYIGYETFKEIIEVKSNLPRSIKLSQTEILVDEVIVTQSNNITHADWMRLNTSEMQMQELSRMPGLFGENDVARNIGLLPGIKTNELSSGNINVRGGSSDQTLFLMDEAKIYNASHFGGIFSVFNPDIVNNVKVYKGELPLSDGGAISSLIDVHLKEGNNQKWRYKASLGVISAKALVEGPIKKNKSSMLIAGRRSYIDLLLGLMRSSIQPSYTNYYFYDFNIKYNNKLNEKNLVFISAYSGKDYLNLLSEIQRTNQMINLRWNHVYNTQLFSNTSVVLSRNYMKQSTTDRNLSADWERNIYNLFVKADFNYYPFAQTRINFGFSGNSTEINSYDIRIFDENVLLSRENGPVEYLYTHSAYLSGEIILFSRLTIDAGIKENYSLNPRAYLHSAPVNANFLSDTTENKFAVFTMEPRVHFRYLLSPSIVFKAGYNRQTNPLHQLDVTDIGITVNRWIPATKGFLPQVSNNFSAGFSCTNNNWLRFDAECYYRTMDNLIETMHNQEILTNYCPDNYLYQSSGKAKGIETSTTLSFNKVEAIINYTFSDVYWKITGINQDDYYPASYNKPHHINIVASYKTGRRLSTTVVWTYASGSPYTPAAAKYMLDGKTMIYFDNTNINSLRLPDYHRLDLSIDLAGKKNNNRSWKNYWNFSIYNVYCHKNPYSLIYYTPVTDDNLNSNIELKPTYLYFYQFVPSVTYRIEF